MPCTRWAWWRGRWSNAVPYWEWLTSLGSGLAFAGRFSEFLPGSYGRCAFAAVPPTSRRRAASAIAPVVLCLIMFSFLLLRPDDAVFAGVFGAIEGFVGAAHQFGRVERVFGIGGHPDADGTSYRLTFDE